MSAEHPIVTINQLLLERATSSSDTPIVGVPPAHGASDDGLSAFYSIHTFRSLYLRVSRLARWLTVHGIVPPRKSGQDPKTVVVALFCQSGWEYIVLEMAITKLGWGVVLLSTNNSVAALTHLLRATGTTHLFYDRRSARSRASAEEATRDGNRSLVGRNGSGLKVLVSPDPEAAYEDESVSLEMAEGRAYRGAFFADASEADLQAFCIHSSGSTGFPKPIWVSHRATVANIAITFDLPAFVTLPLYHNHGHCAFLRALWSKKVLYLYPTPPLPLTSRALVTALNSCDAELFYAVPYVLKLLSETPEGIAALVRLKLVTFAGSACPDEVGNRLVMHGVNLVGHYGATEVGQIMTSFRPFETDKEWNWLRSSGTRSGRAMVDDYIQFEPVGQGAFELIVKEGWPPKVMSNQPDGSFATKDLFVPHPSNPHVFKYVGRKDDTIVHANGEKTAAVPIELSLRESKLIDDAIVFGTGRMQAGALIVLSNDDTIRPQPVVGAWSSTDEEKAREAVWPAVQTANDRAPSHSRLLPEMVRVLPPGSYVPKADKGSIIRARVYDEYASLIEDTYYKFEHGDGSSKTRASSLEEMLAKVVETVCLTLGASAQTTVVDLAPDADFAAMGMDSLQAARVRNVLQRDLDLSGARLGSNVVFEHPTASGLASYLWAQSQGRLHEEVSSTHRFMRAMVDKYSSTSVSGLENRTRKVEQVPRGRVVVLTGATGSLGAHLLDQLLRHTDVARVYCLCRAKDDGSARERVEESMRQRHVPLLHQRSCADDGRVRCLSANTELENLGLLDEVYEEMVEEVTDVMHNAWPVNFNLAVESFEPQIAGARNLIDLCLRHSLRAPGYRPANFFFSSSVSAVVGWKGPEVNETFSGDPEEAQNIGYARSKWIVEQLCKRAAGTYDMRAEVLRIGQMVGDAAVGHWNVTEAFPLMFKSAQTVGALPDLNDDVSWLPVDTAAEVILELVLSETQPAQSNGGDSSYTEGRAAVHHVVSPHSVSWSTVLDGLEAAGLSFERVSADEWLDRLRCADDSEEAGNLGPGAAAERNPVLKLRAFFEEKYGPAAKDRRPRARLCTARTRKLAPALRRAPVVDAEMVTKFVKRWRETGFLS